MADAHENSERVWIAQLRKGLVEFLVLAVLKTQEAYGYQLLQELSTLNGLALTESTLYPVLARLTDEKHLAVRQVPSPSGPPRRYYRLTASGRQRLIDMLAYWRQVNASIETVINSPRNKPGEYS